MTVKNHMFLKVMDKIIEWSFASETEHELSEELKYPRNLNADHVVIDSSFVSDCTGIGDLVT